MSGIKKEKVQLMLWRSLNPNFIVDVYKEFTETFGFDVEKIHYLYTPGNEITEDVGLGVDPSVIEKVLVPIENPADHNEVYKKLKSVLEAKMDRGEFSNLRICATGCTAIMHSVWIILYAGGFFPNGTKVFVAAGTKPENGKGISLTELRFEVNTYLSEIRRAERVSGSESYFEENPKSARMKKAQEEIQKYAGVANVPLLIFGERGIGKTTAAKNWIRTIKDVKENASEKQIDEERKRADKLLDKIRGARNKEQNNVAPDLNDLKKVMKLELRRDINDSFVHVACGSLDKNLAESQIFGYVDGAYTGAKKGGEIGLIEKARNGILFLDEIQDLERPLQRKLLKLLENHVYTMYGDASATEIPIRFSLVCATNVSEKVLKTKLDLDFYDRISMYKVTLPPLRERKEDLLDLWKKTWKSVCKETGNTNLANEPFMDEALKHYLETSDLAGNFRSLRRIALLKIALSNSRTTEEILEMVDADDRTACDLTDDSGNVFFSRYEQIPWKNAEALFKNEFVEYLEKKYGGLSGAAQKMGCTLKTLQNVKKNVKLKNLK